ncbi:hypothetical protein PM082_020312 [Marasmius tenuissimus]|nr:hypothetical protein PM082_020312 [Marasmius tenuissimus]
MSLSLFRQPTATTPSGGVKAFLFAFFVVIYILLYLRYLRPTYPKEHLPETRLLLAILGSTHITFSLAIGALWLLVLTTLTLALVMREYFNFCTTELCKSAVT